MLEAQELTKRYGDQVALDAVTLSVAPGEVFCLLGANGAGKTTTIHLFLGFLSPTSGRAMVNGLHVAAEPLKTKQFLAYIPEQVDLYPHLTGRENLEHFAALAGGKHSASELRSLLVEAGLPEESLERRVGGYSKGMRQKVGVAIALAKKAKVLLLDEPTSGLDPQASNEFSRTIRSLSEKGVAVLMATHDLFRAKECGTRLGIMRRGKLVTTVAAGEIEHADLETLYLDYMRS
ncbi:MAG: ABC transporter ATP-binding protein [Cytophagales bacterium]|nr:ABC transporter ATP-binding protein [Armatimonadota bacterium]